jgi:MFS family permease
MLGLPRAFWAVWLAALVNAAGVIATTMLGVYLMQAHGLSAMQSVRTDETLRGAMLIAGPIGGALSDHFGRRPIMIIGLVGSALGLCVLRFADVSSAAGLSALLMLTGACSGLHRPVFQATLADLVPREDRQRAFSYLVWTGQIGTLAAGGLTQVVIGKAMRPEIAFLIAAAAALTAAGVVFGLVPETRERVARQTVSDALGALAEPFVDVLFMILCVLSFLLTMIVTQDLLLMRSGPANFDVQSIVVVGYVVLQPLMGLALPRLRRSRVLATAALVAGVGIGLNGLLYATPRYDIAAIVKMVVTVAAVPAVQSIAAELAPPARRGAYLGVFALGAGIAVAFGNTLGKQLDALGPRFLWVACLAAGVVVAVGHLALAEARRRRPPA